MRQNQSLNKVEQNPDQKNNDNANQLCISPKESQILNYNDDIEISNLSLPPINSRFRPKEVS